MATCRAISAMTETSLPVIFYERLVRRITLYSLGRASFGFNRFGPMIIVLLALCSSAAAQTPTRGLSLADAIESTLRENPQLKLQQEQVEFNRGSVLRAQSQFDRVIGAGASSGRVYQPLDELQRTVYGLISTTTNTTSIDAEASQQLRNGITVTPMLTITRLTDNLASQDGLNQGHLGIQVNVPLLRGRGRSVVTANETASGVELEASLLDLNQAISNLLFNTATAYWSAVAAERTLDVAKEAEARGKLLLETVQTLVDADRNPRSDLSDVQANLADRTATRIGAEQQLFQANQQLALAMGLSADKVAAIANPADPLPSVARIEMIPSDPQLAIARAFERRADYLAAKKRQGEADILASAAKNQLKPQLDLQLNTGFSGLRGGRRPDEFVISPVSGVHGVDATAGLRYQFPIENRAAEANVVQTRSAASAAAYRIQDTARSISSSVLVAMEGVRAAIQQLAMVNRSVEYSQTALENQAEKYRLGVGSLVEVLTVEDRLTTALGNQVQAELGYALAVARLRQATGTIVEPDKPVQAIDPSIFVRPPELTK